MNHIHQLFEQGDRNVLAYLLSELIKKDKLEISELTTLLNLLPDSRTILTDPHNINGETIEPIRDLLDPLIIAQAIAEIVERDKPENLCHEVILLDVLMDGTELIKSDEWERIFMSLYDYIYLAFCDAEVCKEATNVCFMFFKMLQTDVFQTFTVLYKTLSMIFPQQNNCPTICKTTTVEFLMKSSDLSASFGQNILKLLMSFPPKTHPDLDKLIATLRKVKR